MPDFRTLRQGQHFCKVGYRLRDRRSASHGQAQIEFRGRRSTFESSSTEFMAGAHFRKRERRFRDRRSAFPIDRYIDREVK